MKIFIKTGILFIFFIGFYQKSISQSFDVKWAEKASILDSYEDAVEVENGKFVVLKLENLNSFKAKYKNTKASLILINEDCKIIVEKEKENDPNNTTFISLKKIGKNLLQFYQIFDEATKSTILYVETINQKSLIVENLKKIGSFSAFNVNNYAEIKIKQSNDGSRILILVTIPDGLYTSKKLFLYVFNDDFNKEWEQEVNLPFEKHYRVFEDFCISNQGKAYLSFRSSYKAFDLKHKVKDLNNFLSILTFTKDTTIKEKEILTKLENCYLRGSYLVLTEKDELLKVAGLWEPLRKKEDVFQEGIFYSFIETKTGEIRSKNFVRFDEDLIKLVSIDGFANNKTKNFGLDPYYNSKGIIARKNGSIDLICEYSREHSYSSYSGKNFEKFDYFTDSWIYGTLVNINISQSGKVVFTRIPKTLSNLNNSYLSSFDRPLPNIYGSYPLVQNDTLIYFYNDSKENIVKDLSKETDIVKDFNKVTLVTSIIYPDGNFVRKLASVNNIEDFCTMPIKFTRLNESVIFLQSSQLKNGKYKPRFGIMKIKF